MKKLSTIIMAIALVLGLSQCKKQETPTAANIEEGKVHITVNVENAGGRHHIEPSVGGYIFTAGDVLYVGNGGHYVGTLEYQNGAFSGDIESPSTDDFLHFYFVGGKQPGVTPDDGSVSGNPTTDFTVNISDQSSNLPVLAYGRTIQKYNGPDGPYTTMLKNLCALVKFGLASDVNDVVTVEDMLTEATVNFATPGINPEATTGDITLYSETETAKWAILLPQDNPITSFTVNIREKSYTVTGSYSITNNGYINSGIAIANPPTGAINGLFSVSSTDQVYFSRGNLQYMGSAATPYWQFAEHQWVCLGDNGQGSTSETADRDLFGWGTSGYNHGANNYQPYSTSTLDINYQAYGANDWNLYDQTGKADWGYNAIINGNNLENSGWRTLTTAEWGYVFNSRTDAANKYGHGKVNDVNGLILLPDAWTLPTGLSFTPGNSAWTNVYTADQWAQMEANGAVFLPAAGVRTRNILEMIVISNVGTQGYYWSSSHYSEVTGSALYMNFESKSHSPQAHSSRKQGYSVRLVKASN